jgi:probable phosphoglycerate mutase
MRIFLIRHGETEWSLSGQHTGITDIPLTAHGETQAASLVPRLKGVAFSHVFASPRQRARRTCELAGLGAQAVTEPAVAEWDYGDYEGRRSADIRRDRPDWAIFRDGCPGGESPGQISARADGVIDRLSKLDGDIAVFSHGQFGCVLAARWIGLPVVEGERFAFGPACLSILGYHPSHPDVRVIELWNEASHRP